MSLTQFIRRGEAHDDQKQERSAPVNTVPRPVETNTLRPLTEARKAALEPKQVQRREDLPQFNELLTGPGACAEVTATDQGAVALLGVGDKQAVVVWSGQSDHARAKRYAQRRASDAGYSFEAQQYVAPSDVLRVLYRHGGAGGLGTRAASTDKGASESDTVARLQQLVAGAVEAGASDIHLRVFRGKPTDILYRVNGRLRLVQQISEDVGFALARTIHRKGGKGKTGIDLDVDRPQDANVEVVVDATLNGKVTQVATNERFGSVPERTGGVNIALRVIITNQAIHRMTLEEAGYDEPQCRIFRRLLSSPNGLCLLVGTTGSGKSMTLHILLSMLHEKFGESRAINTIEQPVEYVIDGVIQSPVREAKDGENDPDAGFAPMLRALLRNDPDIIMVGEIRDEETGAASKNAVETGHPVFSTLHAKDCVGAMHRLISLGVEREVACSVGFVNIVAYQALAPEVCTQCALSYEQAVERGLVENELRQRILKRVGGQGLRNTRWENPEGCEACGFSGVGGRTVCAEVFTGQADELELLVQGKVTHARMRWRARAAENPEGVEGWTAQDAAVKKMMAGRVAPTAVEDGFGLLDSEVTPEEAGAWLKQHRLRRMDDE